MLKSPWIQSAALLLGGLCCTLTSAQTNVSPLAAPASAAHPIYAHHWRETRLYFGLGPADAPDKGVSESIWRAFLDSKVTPRFPSGLSVADVYGQWQGATSTPVERLRSKVLIVDYPPSHANAAKIEAIRSAWKRQTGDVSVLSVTQVVDVSF